MRIALAAAQRRSRLLAMPTGFGVVELGEDDQVSGFDESPKLPHWVHAGVDVLDEEAIARLPEKGDHERTTFPELAAEGKLYAFRHEGLWLTVNTPKDLRTAEEHMRREPQLALRGGESMTTESPNLGGLEPFAVRADQGRQAVGARADLGPDGRLLRQAPVHQGRRVA